MFRILKKSDPLLQQFEIVEKENTDPQAIRRDKPDQTFERKDRVCNERDALDQAFDAMMV
jgi:hypothetical protein